MTLRVALVLFAIIPSVLQAKDLFVLYGDAFQALIPAYAFAYSYVKKDSIGKKQFLIYYTTSMTTTYALKYATNETRPNGGRYSFPSGHASSAFAGAWYLQKRYGYKHGIPALALATLVGISRVYAKAHYTKDVVGSVAITFALSSVMVDRYSVNIEKEGKSYKLSLSYRW